MSIKSEDQINVENLTHLLLLNLGSRNACLRALIVHPNNINAAANWIIEHQSDANIDRNPFLDGGQSQSQIQSDDGSNTDSWIPNGALWHSKTRVNWKMIAQCIRHEMSPMMSTSIEAAVASVKAHNLTNESVERVIMEMQKRISLSNVEGAYIRGAVKRAIEYAERRDVNGIEIMETTIYLHTTRSLQSACFSCAFCALSRKGIIRTMRSMTFPGNGLISYSIFTASKRRINLHSSR